MPSQSELSALATILSVEVQQYPTITKSLGSFEGLFDFAFSKEIFNYIHFEVEVNPPSGSLFKSKFTSLVNSSRLFPELLLAGAKIWVKYDSKDPAKIEFEKFEKEEESRQREADLP